MRFGGMQFCVDGLKEVMTVKRKMKPSHKRAISKALKKAWRRRKRAA